MAQTWVPQTRYTFRRNTASIMKDLNDLIIIKAFQSLKKYFFQQSPLRDEIVKQYHVKIFWQNFNKINKVDLLNIRKWTKLTKWIYKK